MTPTPARTHGSALPLAPDPVPTAADRPLLRRIDATLSFDDLVTHLRPSAARTPAVLTAALAWVAQGHGVVSSRHLPTTYGWYEALSTALGRRSWTVTMDAWYAHHTTTVATAVPSTLRRTAARWARGLATPEVLDGAITAALASPHRAWLVALLHHAPAWTPATVHRIIEPAGAIRLRRDFLTNPAVPPAVWRDLERSLAFQRVLDTHTALLVTEVLRTLWARTGASPETRRRATAILREAHAAQTRPRHLGFGDELSVLIAGGHLPWAACARWAARVTSPAVMRLLLLHPDLPGPLAGQWLATHGTEVEFRRAAALHPTLGASAAVRHALWPYLQASSSIQALFLRHGTPDEVRFAFTALVGRAPYRALTLLAARRPHAGFAIPRARLERLLAHPEARVRLAAIAALPILHEDAATPPAASAPTDRPARRSPR